MYDGYARRISQRWARQSYRGSFRHIIHLLVQHLLRGRWLDGYTILVSFRNLQLRLRSKGSAISILSKWMFNFLVVMISPVAMSNIGYRTYIIFAVLNFVFVFVIYFFYPETKGLALEQVDRIFIGGDSITRGAMRRRQITGDDFTPTSEEKPEPDEHVEDVKKTQV